MALGSYEHRSGNYWCSIPCLWYPEPDQISPYLGDRSGLSSFLTVSNRWRSGNHTGQTILPRALSYPWWYRSWIVWLLDCVPNLDHKRRLRLHKVRYSQEKRSLCDDGRADLPDHIYPSVSRKPHIGRGSAHWLVSLLWCVPRGKPRHLQRCSSVH